MSLPIQNSVVGRFLLPVISGLAVILCAAALDLDVNWARLRGLPSERRAKLVENLKKFDLLYSRSQQETLRQLDRKIYELPAETRTQYLAALARYHNWLNQLPDAKQEELTGLPAAERMAAVKKLVAEYPLRNPASSRFVRQVDLGEYSPFELASLFRIWQALGAVKRGEVEKFPAIPKRHDVMYKAAETKDIPYKIEQPTIDEETSTTRLEEFAKRNRLTLLVNELRKNKEKAQGEVVRDLVRREAINHYFVENPPKPVAPERLSEFLAAFPPWLQSAFDSHSPEEAQRRLTIVYRLVFPYPSEIKPVQRPSSAAALAPPVTKEPVGRARPSGKAPSRAGDPPL